MKSLWCFANIVVMMVVGAIAEEPPYACDNRNPATRSCTFCDASKPITVRVEDLISRLSLVEKVEQVSNNASVVQRLGIPKYEWWSEALHGVSRWGRSIHFNGPIHTTTSFPQVILTAASFDATLWYRIAQV
jgi:beta-glucosidase-like glycosyl hydrolase